MICGLVATVVNRFGMAGHTLFDLYKKIYSHLQERKLMQIDAKQKDLNITQEDENFLEWAFNTLAHNLGFSDLQIENLKEINPNPLARLKMLLSLYRRARRLAEFQKKGKILLPPTDEK